MDNKIPVAELFSYTIQGEGALAGQVSAFLRTSYCPLKCIWCDSMHAVDPEKIKKTSRWLLPDQILAELEEKLGTAGKQGRLPWVTLTGGDPVMWGNLDVVVDGLLLRGHKLAVETEGFLWQDWLEKCDLVTVSPKPPSSGMADKLNIPLLQKYHARLAGRLVAKVVVFNDEDLEFAARVRRFFPNVPFYLSSGTEQESDDYRETILHVCRGFKTLSEKVCADPRFHDAIVLPQLHVLAWGRDLGR